MKTTKLLCLLLSLTMLCSVLVACNDGGGGNNGGGGRVDGSWESVDFDGQEVRFAVSVNQYDEGTFPAASIYTKGPDVADSNEVTKEVLARNARAVADLNITINYMERDLTYLKVPDDIKDIVLSNSSNSPDIYNNDLWGLARAMYNGYLWNTKDPGKDAAGNAYTNYFDYTADGWYEEFTRGCTFDQNKYYLFAGDYFVDMLRLAWVVYVNNDAMNEHKGNVKWLDSVDDFYARVEVGEWDFDMLKKMSDAMKVGTVSGKTQLTDPLVGFLIIGNITEWSTAPSAGAAIFYLDENKKPCLIEDTSTFQKIANAYVDMVGQEDNPRSGVYCSQDSVISTIEAFAGGNVLFLSSRMGEMESSVLRNVDFAKGIVPIPKWSATQQDDYHTTVHDQAEIGCILKSAKAYSAASALMQYLNEESDLVLNAYYEKGMKYKYNDDRNSRVMMDMIREATDDPFSSIIGLLALQLYDLPGSISRVGPKMLQNTTISSTFNSEKDAYKYCLNKMIEKFASFE